MSLAESQALIIETYARRTDNLREYLDSLSGPQRTEVVREFMLQNDMANPILVGPSALYHADNSPEALDRGAHIQKYQNCFDSIWEQCEQNSLISSFVLRALLKEAEHKPAVRRRQRRRKSAEDATSNKDLQEEQRPGLST